MKSSTAILMPTVLRINQRIRGPEDDDVEAQNQQVVI